MLHPNVSARVQITSHTFALLSPGLDISSQGFGSPEILAALQTQPRELPPSCPEPGQRSPREAPHPKHPRGLQEQQIWPRFPLLLPRRDTWMPKSGCAALTSPLPWPPAGFLLFLPVPPILELSVPHRPGFKRGAKLKSRAGRAPFSRSHRDKQTKRATSKLLGKSAALRSPEMLVFKCPQPKPRCVKLLPLNYSQPTGCSTFSPVTCASNIFSAESVNPLK